MLSQLLPPRRQVSSSWTVLSLSWDLFAGLACRLSRWQRSLCVSWIVDEGTRRLELRGELEANRFGGDSQGHISVIEERVDAYVSQDNKRKCKMGLAEVGHNGIAKRNNVAFDRQTKARSGSGWRKRKRMRENNKRGKRSRDARLARRLSRAPSCFRSRARWRLLGPLGETFQILQRVGAGANLTC